MLGAIAVVALVATSCSAQAEILTTSAPAATDSLAALDAPTLSGGIAEPTPLAAATPAPALDAVPDGWVTYDLGAFALDVPGQWQAITRSDQVASMVEAAKENGAEFPRQAVGEFQGLLENGNALIAVGDNGDNVNAFRQFGTATILVQHEKIADALTGEFAGFANDVSFSSEPRVFGDTPGVLVRGSYTIEGEELHMYQFQTHSGTYLYFFTITLFTGDDPALATALFRSVEVR